MHPDLLRVRRSSLFLLAASVMLAGCVSEDATGADPADADDSIAAVVVPPVGGGDLPTADPVTCAIVPFAPGAGAACAPTALVPGTANAARSCHPFTVMPSATNATASLEAALASASAQAASGARGLPIGPGQARQGRVYLPAGIYALDPIAVPSNVRVEIEPGAIIRGRKRNNPGTSPRGIFTFDRVVASDGSGTIERVHNVTFTTGDGCGGPGTPTLPGTFNKPASTCFRGNSLGVSRFGTRGMQNTALPHSSRWAPELPRMWVVDLDPRATGGDPHTAAFLFHDGADLAIDHVLTIENAEQQNDDVDGGPIEGVTSRIAALMFHPPDVSEFGPDREAWHVPHRVAIDWLYNVLSPAGQGATQIRTCVDCTFDHVFSHGGVPLRIETDGIDSACGSGVCCASSTEPDGVGFSQFAIVDGLKANTIEGLDGNSVVMLSPHCLPSGTVNVACVYGEHEDLLLEIERGQRDGTGSFTSARITGVAGRGGSFAQERHAGATPGTGGYVNRPSTAAIEDGAPWDDAVRLAGIYQWPRADSCSVAHGGLADGDLTALRTASTFVKVATGCPQPRDGVVVTAVR